MSFKKEDVLIITYTYLQHFLPSLSDGKEDSIFVAGPAGIELLRLLAEDSWELRRCQ
jgi:hypothetical protein